MNIMGMQMSKKEFIKLMKNRLKDVIIECQYRLLNMKFTIAHPDDFVGKCDKASDLFIEMIKKESYFNPNLSVQYIRATVNNYDESTIVNAQCLRMSYRKIHGELAHSTLIPSKYWTSEHTMVELIIEGIRFYVDPTCLQFEPIVSKEYKIGYFYCNTKCPRWFLPDEKNIRFTKFGEWLDQHKFTIDEKLDKKLLMSYDIEYEAKVDIDMDIYINNNMKTFHLPANETHYHEEWFISDKDIPIRVSNIYVRNNQSYSDYEVTIRYHSLKVHKSIKHNIGLCEFIQFKVHGKISDLFLPRALTRLKEVRR